MISLTPPVFLNAEINALEQKSVGLRVFKTYYEAKDFAMHHKGVIGQYLDGRWFVVYERNVK